MLTTAQRQYPIGKVAYTPGMPSARREALIAAISTLPDRLSEVAAALGDHRLDQSYREGGWSARQVIHHLSESHMHAYARLKFALTEDNPVIKPYDEGAWTMRADATKAPIDPSLVLLQGLQARLSEVFRSLSEPEWARTYLHPQYNRTFTLEDLLTLYAWHGDHHLAHLNIIADGHGM